MIKLKIKKGDTVEIVCGSDKGKKGQVLQVLLKKMKILVQGVRIQTHFDKEKGQFEKEGYIDYSNVKLVSKKAATSKAAAPKAKK